VVIAIISILASLLLPALEQALTAAHVASCLNQHRQMGLGIALYGDENDTYLPGNYTLPGNRANNMLTGYNDANAYHGLGLLWRDYGLGEEVFYCPGRETHGKDYNGAPKNCDYATGWPYWGADTTKQCPKLQSFLTNGVASFKDGVSLYGWQAIRGLSILVADVRVRSQPGRYGPMTVPHDGQACLLLVDGGAVALPDLFGDTVPLQSLSTRTPPVADRNEKPYHQYGRDWWYYATKQVRER
jgi:hypothetical protein